MQVAPSASDGASFYVKLVYYKSNIFVSACDDDLLFKLINIPAELAERSGFHN